MNKNLLLLFFCLWSAYAFSQTTFFNEVDYQSAAPNQCLEIVSPESEDLTDWSVHIYDDSGFLSESVDLGAIVPSSTVSNLDIIIVDIVLLTSPKAGMVIEDNAGAIVQFLNYGTGTITAQDGPASGLTSENIGEQSVPGTSLQLTGTGTEYTDFINTGGWLLPGASTCGMENLLQTLVSPLLLPVDLLYFNANQDQDRVLIDWATLSEENSFYFLVERSVNGSAFETIYRTNAAGYSNEYLSYSFIDYYPPNGKLYYRLTEVDYDGLTMKSDIVAIQNTLGDEETLVYPNPVENEMFLVLPEEMDNVQVSIHDLVTGRQYFYKEIEQPDYRIQLDTEKLEPGHYLIRLRSRGFIHEQRFIKVHVD